MCLAIHLNTFFSNIYDFKTSKEVVKVVENVSSIKKVETELKEEIINVDYILEKDTYPSFWNDRLNDIVWLEASAETGIPAPLLMAISIHETGNFTSNIFRNYNNVGGNLSRGRAMRFNSFEDGVKYMARNLKNNRAYRNVNWKGNYKDMISSIQRVYAPIGTSNDPRNLNSHWYNGVLKFYLKITENENVNNIIIKKHNYISKINEI